MADDAERSARFSVFMARHQERLQRFAFLLTGDSATAEDLTQSAFLLVLRRWDRMSDPQNAEAYLRKVVVNHQRSRWRLKSARREILVAEAPQGEASDFTNTIEARLQLQSALLELPQRQRQAVVLRYYEDLSEAVTAQIMGCSVGTVKSQASRGLARLRQTLPDLEVDHVH